MASNLPKNFPGNASAAEPAAESVSDPNLPKNFTPDMAQAPQQRLARAHQPEVTRAEIAESFARRLDALPDLDGDTAWVGNVVMGAKITGELLPFLLAHNRSSLFGAFGLDPDGGTITFDHSIIGSTCDKKELFTSMSEVVRTADRMDDIIIEKLGGQSALATAQR